MLETTTDGFVALDTKGRIIYFNAVSERLSGKGRSDVLGKLYFRVCPELQGTTFESEVSAALKTSSNLDFEYFHEPAAKWFKVRGTPNIKGGLSIFFHDITEHKQFQEEKKTVHQRSFEILEAIEEAFLALDSEERMTYINGNAERLWQKPRNELLGKVIWDIFPHLAGSDFQYCLRERMDERTRFMSSALFGKPMMIEAHPCAGGACIYAHEAHSQAKTQAATYELTFAVQDAERQRIARELHDSAGQLLAALAIGLTALSEARSLGSAKRQALHLQQLVHRVTKELGYLSRTLYGAEARSLKLVSALRRLCADFAETFGVNIRMTGRPSNVSVQKTTQLTAYRILQEALSNVARHAKAERVRVGVRITPSRVYLKIVDDGRGFAEGEIAAASNSHMGLKTMRDRAELLGGTLAVHSQLGRGTCVRAVLPNLPRSVKGEA